MIKIYLSPLKGIIKRRIYVLEEASRITPGKYCRM